MESKYIRADLLMNKIARNAFFSAAEKGKICVVIEKEPEEDVQPVVHAHWKLDPNGMDFGISAWKCSNCGGRNGMIPPFIATKQGGYVPKNPNVFAGSNYCPYCGAKMDEEGKA